MLHIELLFLFKYNSDDFQRLKIGRLTDTIFFFCWLLAFQHSEVEQMQTEIWNQIYCFFKKREATRSCLNFGQNINLAISVYRGWIGSLWWQLNQITMVAVVALQCLTGGALQHWGFCSVVVRGTVEKAEDDHPPPDQTSLAGMGWNNKWCGKQLKVWWSSPSAAFGKAVGPSGKPMRGAWDSSAPPTSFPPPPHPAWFLRLSFAPPCKTRWWAGLNYALF